jgi:outer membrane lipoprotein-sorting protein
MIALLVLMLAQDSAEAAFQKIEAALAKADTIKIAVKCKAVMSGAGKEMRAELEGTLLMKGVGKVRVSMTAKEDEEPPQKLEFVSDGANMRGPGTRTAEAPKDLRQSLLKVLPKLGASVAMQTVLTIGAGRLRERDPVASNFTSRSSELAFDVAYDGSTWKTTLGFDEKTHKILRLETRVKPTDPKSPGKAGTSRTITETMQMETGIEIPDKEFEIVEKK